MTHIDPAALRIVINRKEIYPNREILRRWMENCCIINLKLKLLGGGQEYKKRQKKEELIRTDMFSQLATCEDQEGIDN